jgi:tellurite resistance-related uncharacterized protein
MTGLAPEPATTALLPSACQPYRRTPVFTEATVPSALLRSHRTAPGTWALIRVLGGRLLYRVLDPCSERTRSERTLDPWGAPGLVEPGVPHEVAPLGPVRFQVEFYKMATVSGGVPAGVAAARARE